MTRPVFVATVIGAGLGALSLLWFVGMMAMMASGHGGMMGWGRGSDPNDETAVVGVTDVRGEDFAFSPANIVVDVGATVTWTNEHGVSHTVSSGGDELASPLFGRGETYRRTFDEAGTYAYYCKPHPYMKGLVTVR
jgi:plastocyanin